MERCILQGSVRDAKVNQTVGLGGCYKSVMFGTSWADMDFCSKKCFAISSKEEGHGVMIRDFMKALGTSNYYTGSNKAICSNPFQHSYLVGEILLSEVGPRLNKCLGVAWIKMGKAWDISKTLNIISLHRMMLNKMDVNEDV